MSAHTHPDPGRLTMHCPACIEAANPRLPQVAEHLSVTSRRTARNNALLARGVHPATHRPTTDAGCCGDCAHHVIARLSRTYHKCARHVLGTSNSDASDIRVGWPSCELYEPAPETP